MKSSATSHSNNAGALDFEVSVRIVSYTLCHNSSIAFTHVYSQAEGNDTEASTDSLQLHTASYVSFTV